MSKQCHKCPRPVLNCQSVSTNLTPSSPDQRQSPFLKRGSGDSSHPGSPPTLEKGLSEESGCPGRPAPAEAGRQRKKVPRGSGLGCSPGFGDGVRQVRISASGGPFDRRSSVLPVRRKRRKEGGPVAGRRLDFRPGPLGCAVSWGKEMLSAHADEVQDLFVAHVVHGGAPCGLWLRANGFPRFTRLRRLGDSGGSRVVRAPVAARPRRRA